MFQNPSPPKPTVVTFGHELSLVTGPRESVSDVDCIGTKIKAVGSWRLQISVVWCHCRRRVRNRAL